MYDEYKDPERITVMKVREQESSAPDQMEASMESEPGYVLTPTGKSRITSSKNSL